MTEEENKSDEQRDHAADADPKEKGTESESEESEEEPPQDPVKLELNRVRGKGKSRTELEKARFARQQIDSRIKELEGDSGVAADPIEEDDNAPVTVGMLKKRELERATKTALTLANEQIEDEDERELTKHYLENNIKPSGNAAEDLRLARSIVNSKRNVQIAEEVTRRQTPSNRSKNSGGPSKREDVFEPTAEETAFMRAPFNLKKEDIIKARQATAEKNA